jgi:iron(III) transport system substrate-binding protein
MIESKGMLTMNQTSLPRPQRVRQRRPARSLLIVFILHLAFPLVLAAQDNHTQKLIEGAKKEDALVWYTSASIEDVKAIFTVFGKKHPFIRTDFFRAGSAALFNRILNEARAGKVLFDLIAIRGLETHQLVKAGFLQRYVSPESTVYPAGFKDSHGYWVDYFDAYNVIGYNTKLLSRDQAPKSWEDLLDPKWKGKIALDEENFSWCAPFRNPRSARRDQAAALGQRSR